MGVSFSLRAKKPARRLLGFLDREPDWKAIIESAIAAAARDLGIDFLVPPPAAGVSGRVAAHLCEEWPDLEVDDYSIVLSARTSTCGPGYHAFMIDVVDLLGRAHQLQFVEEDEHFDESGYFRSRDFEALQEYHAEWLHSLAGSIVDLSYERDVDVQMIGFPVGNLSPLGMKEDHRVATQQGWLHLDALSELAEADQGVIQQFAESWFPWWERSPSARDYVRAARSLMWVEVPWHAPVNDHEKHVMSAAIRCCERARQIDPAIDTPSAELREIEYLLGLEEESTTPPSSEGVGYRRRMCRWPLGNDWSIVLPGYWYTFHDDDGWGMTFNGQNVWVSTFSVKHKDGSSPQSEEPLEHTAPRPEERTLFELKTTERNHRLTVLATPDVNCEFTYFLQVTRHDGMVAITFAGYDPEWEKEIPAIARSVR